MSNFNFDMLSAVIKASALIFLVVFLLSNWVSKYKRAKEEDGGITDLFLLIKKGFILIAVFIFFINLF